MQLTWLHWLALSLGPESFGIVKMFKIHCCKCLAWPEALYTYVEVRTIDWYKKCWLEFSVPLMSQILYFLYTVHTVQLNLNLACMYVFYLCKTLKCGVCFLSACGLVVHTSAIKHSLSHWVCVTWANSSRAHI